jgi:hypothetical protein
MPAADHAPARGRGRALLGLLLTPVVVGVAAIALSRLRVAVEIANIVVFGGAASTVVASLATAARSYPPPVWRLATMAVAIVALGGFAWAGVTSIGAAVVVDALLIAGAWAMGTSIGRRIEHPGHLLPACVVVACADATSIVSQFGPTHAMAQSERALSVVAFAFPVPGTPSFAPALGVGDLVFMAIVFGAVVAHGLSLLRAAVLCWLGVLAAGAASALWETAVPALVLVGAAVVLGVPEARRLRPADRRVATLAMAIAVAVAAAAIVSQLVRPGTDTVVDE